MDVDGHWSLKVPETLQVLGRAAPAPSFVVLPGSSGRRLQQASSGVQAQVNVQSTADVRAAVAAALQQAINDGSFQAALARSGLLKHLSSLGTWISVCLKISSFIIDL